MAGRVSTEKLSTSDGPQKLVDESRDQILRELTSAGLSPKNANAVADRIAAGVLSRWAALVLGIYEIWALAEGYSWDVAAAKAFMRRNFPDSPYLERDA